MSVLVVQIPPRRRLSAQAESPEAGPSAAPNARKEYAWIRTDNGLSIAAHGHSAAALLPQADAVVAVLADCDVSWQRVNVPLAPPSKLRAAISGVLEEALLDEPEALHLALAPEAAPGQKAWVAVMNRAWLEAELAAIERGGALVDRVVPSLWPGDSPRGHFFNAATDGQDPTPAIAMADLNGIVCLPLAGTLARAMLPQAAAETNRWTAPPAVAAVAERWLGAPVAVQSEFERMLNAARSLWNLRQFELAPKRRGTVIVRDAWMRVMSPAWRPVRVGVLALAGVSVLGLNARAWSQRDLLQSKRQAQTVLLSQTFPQVRAVLDAPLQMERETDLLRAAAGRPADADLEPLIAAAAAAWPDGQPALHSMRFQPGQLTIATPGWTQQDTNTFVQRLRPAGWAVEQVPGRVSISRANKAAANAPATAGATP